MRIAQGGAVASATLCVTGNGAGVYAIINKINGHRYVGSSVNIKTRFRDHKRDLRNGRHKNIRLQGAWRKYGEDTFEFVVLEHADRSLVREREQFHIDQGASYNCIALARGGVLTHSDQTRRKITAALVGRKNPHGTPPQQANCLICGSEFTAQASVVKSGRAKYCSRRCMGLAVAPRMVALAHGRRGKPSHKRKRVEKSCPTCGALFEIAEWRVRRASRVFCSLSCMGVGNAQRRWGISA